MKRRELFCPNCPTKSLDTSTLKIFTAEAVTEFCHKALQICGGHGYIKVSPTERYYRDGRLMDIGAGSIEVLKQVVGSTVLKYDQ